MKKTLHFILILFFSFSFFSAYSQVDKKKGGADKPPYQYDLKDTKRVIQTPSGLKYVIIEEGSGPLPTSGENVKVHYHGMLEDKKVFDSSFDRGGPPIEFPLGQGRVIKGWDEGIAKLKKGTKAVLIIPANLAYGAQGRPSIPPNSTLIFHVHLQN